MCREKDVALLASPRSPEEEAQKRLQKKLLRYRLWEQLAFGGDGEKRDSI
jgi:hypothetical protein